MATARPACAPQLFSSPVGTADLEFGRVLHTADPGAALDGPLTFRPAAGLSPAAWLDSWGEWRQNLLAERLVPALLSAAPFATGGRVREMLALDRELDAALAPEPRGRSRAAGRRLLTRLASSRGERWLGKFQQAVASDGASAHFAVIYAGQHALFHLPLRLLVPAYAYWEWSAAMSGCPAVGGPAPDFARETESLCRLAHAILPSPSSTYAVQNLPAASSDR